MLQANNNRSRNLSVKIESKSWNVKVDSIRVYAKRRQKQRVTNETTTRPDNVRVIVFFASTFISCCFAEYFRIKRFTISQIESVSTL